MNSVLCLADDPIDAAALEDLLEQVGHVGETTDDPEHALERLSAGETLAVLAVCQRPHHHGLELLTRLDRRDAPPVIIIAGDATTDHVVMCMRAGALDYLPKPIRPDRLRTTLAQADAQAALRTDQRQFARSLSTAQGVRRLTGSSPQIQALRRLIGMVAPTNATVLIEGESGTGKEVVARSVHEQSRQAGGPFVTINCAAIPESLIESTLFGHERGAFTGATARAAGAFERASGGTLFLDEISELRVELQAKLLRVLQEHEFERVGGRETQRTDARVIASSNRDLAREVADGRFRSDLYYRLRVFPVRTPPLRERIEDMPDLLAHHLVSTAASLDVPPPPVPESTLNFLAGHSWPGNVRELVNAVYRAVIIAAGAPLLPQHFLLEGDSEVATTAIVEASTERFGAVGTPRSDELPLNLAELEMLAIQRALAATDGHRANAAKLLGVSERTLRNRLNTPAVA
ncbi:MAG: sigma-54 dependent transcriptional regulator [Gemmatimonadales bacterium]|nr:sigma-54 dependent transcriptional regulator [Gemmatimonadales bacterium]MDZ4388968.1 sigma-54 dependent transcriptional regulator [Gemmatimonadales bacterium]